MKLTKLKALELCRDLWKWLLKNPPSVRNKYPWFKKTLWPGWAKLKLKQAMMDSCPCCEYAKQHSRNGSFRDCSLCPLGSLWGTNDIACISVNSVNGLPSPYRTWSYEGERVNSAKTIIAACEQEIKKLKSRKEK
ncbi:MAG: hypothetical protein KGL39_02710 [Patescibacteria group bacterium]|nr:hypothetical protein [Patescibacteria group bacterium]